jgi:hypothetical protein
VASFVAVYDACVLHPAALRDLLLHLALLRLFRARWTDRIHDEWIQSLLERRADIDPARLARTRARMDAAVPDALVTGYDGLIDQVVLPDPDDRHVLAAAIRCQAGVIVTYNTRDFPSAALEPYGIDAQHPDAFVAHLIDLDAASVCAAVQNQRESLQHPPYSARELLDTFRRLELATTVAALEPMQDLL